MAAPDTAMDFFAKPQRLVKINSRRRMNMWRSGKGSPTVILAPGFLANTSDWALVQPALSRITRVVSYDHAGQGFSDPGPLPRTPARNAADLKAMLVSASVEPPYVLVGLSMGGFEVRHFAHEHPDEVIGMVLVDPSYDNALGRMQSALSDMSWLSDYVAHMKRCATSAMAGELRPGTEAYDACAIHPKRHLTEALNAVYHDISLRASFWRSLASEYEAFVRDRADWPLGDLPLILLSAGRREYAAISPDDAEALERLWNAAHDEMVQLSSRGVRRLVPDSGHAIQLDRPQAVIDAVLDVIVEVGGNRK